MEVLDRVSEHLVSAREAMQNDYFVIALQGSHNYMLNDENSDIDTKLLTLPTMRELVLNSKSLNKVHIMENDEHCDCKDVRDYFKIMRKMNINFSEILYTDYWIANYNYQDIWFGLKAMREDITGANPYRFMKCCKGMVLEKAHALCHPYPSKLDILEKYGYDGKQLSHMMRVYEFAKRYSEGESYESCLIPTDIEYLLAVKRHTAGISLEDALKASEYYCSEIGKLEAKFNQYRKDEFDEDVEERMNEILYELIVRSIKKEI